MFYDYSVAVLLVQSAHVDFTVSEGTDNLLTCFCIAVFGAGDEVSGFEHQGTIAPSPPVSPSDSSSFLVTV